MSLNEFRSFYSSRELDFESIYVDRAFEITFPNSSSFQITSNSSCVFDNVSTTLTSSAGSVDVVCSAVGLVVFTIMAMFGTNVQTQMYVTVQDAPCYQWYFVALDQDNIHNSINVVQVNETIQMPYYGRAWIIDTTTADALELNNTAVVPSQTSIQLTRGYASVGLRPQLKGWENICCWKEEIGFWEIYSSHWFQDQVLKIQGNDVSLVGCKVKEIKPRIYLKNFIPENLFNSAVSSAASNSNFSMFFENCNKSATVAFSSVYGAQNFAFSNSGGYNMSIYTGYSNYYYKSASLTGNGILLLGSSGLEFLNNSITTTFTLNDDPQKLRYVDYCPSVSRSVLGWVFSVVTAFSNQTLHVSFDGGYHFAKEVALSQMVFETSTVGAFIRDVTIQPSFNNLAVLIRDSDGLDRIVLYDLEFGNIQNGYNFTSNAIDGGILGSSPGLLASSNGEMLAYGDNLFYSLAKSSTEFISQLALGLSGIFAVLTSSNRVFIGNSDMMSMTELVSGIPYNTRKLFCVTLAVRIAFDFEHLYVFGPSASGSLITSRVIPVRNQIISSKSSTILGDVCPFNEFSTNFSRSVNLDRGDAVKLYFSLLFSPEQENSLAYAFTNLSLIRHEENFTDADAVAALSQTGYVEIHPAQTNQTGLVEVRLEPKSVNLACSSLRATATIKVGCPTSKTMHIIPPTQYVPYPPHTPRVDWKHSLGHATYTVTKASFTMPTLSTDCDSAPSMITLGAGSWISDWSQRTVGQAQKVIPYDCSKYGNPIRLYYGDVFRPSFANYRAGLFEEYVYKDIAIWEDYGQSSFSFNTSQSVAGCLRISQKIEDFISNTTTDISDIWNPTNYQKCYTGDGEGISSSSAYPLLNYSNYNAIRWTSGRNGFYLFSARVMDPEQSFCTLTANFAVEVYGAPLAPEYQAAIVLGIMALILGLLTVSYYAQRSKLVKKHKAE